MEERKKERTGKGLRIEIKAVVRENGTTRRIFLNYPEDIQNFDRPENTIYHVLSFLKTIYPKLDLTNFVQFCSKYDDKEKDFAMKAVKESVLKRNGDGKL